MSIICFSLLLLLLLLLFPLQVFSARPLGFAIHSNMDPADEGTTLVHDLSHKNENETKIDVPFKEVTPTSPARDQNETLEDDNNNKDQAKPRITSSSATKESKQTVMVSWKLPDHQKNKKRRKKKKMRRGGISHDPELALDYAPPRVHPPCHN